MGQPYVGEIRIFAGNFEPAGWKYCNGQLLPISEFETLFNLIGTTYGGDGQSDFALPNLQSRVPLHAGQGPGLSQTYQLAETGGVEMVTLTVQQIGAHNHRMTVAGAANSGTPAGNLLADEAIANALAKPYAYSAAAPNTTLRAGSIGSTGGSQPHDNLQPYLALNFIISLFGVFPPQT